MRPFAALLERLLLAPQRNAKLRLLTAYLAETPDPDRGYALAALTGDLSFAQAKPGAVRALAAERLDPVLFSLSYDFVGDLAETVSLLWPAAVEAGDPPALSEVILALDKSSRARAPALVADWLDRLDETGRWALLKLITGGLRVGVSARLAKLAVAEHGGVAVEEIEELWHGLTPPYAALLAWLEGRGPCPEPEDTLVFRPAMLANPLEDGELEKLDPAAYAAEWKWDGIRVQLAARDGAARLFSRTGDEIGRAFPDLLETIDFDAVLDGELLVARGDEPPQPPFEPAPFNDLQQRLNRKTVSPALRRRHPVVLRVYDLLFADGDDLRPLPFATRRDRLETWRRGRDAPRLDLSPLVPFETWDGLRAIRAETRERGIEGLMLKRLDSAYVPGRPKGPWFKWKRDALTVDTVLMYAQRGHGKRSSYYSDFTFGCWRDGPGAGLVPVGKAYFGFTDQELGQLDRFVRANTTNRFGPVREVTPALVLEIAFDSVHRSSRHKSGVAMRFPRVHRIRWDKPAAEADLLETLEGLIEA